jgi:ABC-2 type transport system ATP-binding protein
MQALGVVELTKQYGNFTAVDHITFSVDVGEFFGFLGPNGAGKTTTMRMLTGLSEPSAGTAAIMGHDISKDPYRAKAHFGVVSETSNVYEEMSAWNNLLFAGELYGIPRAERTRRAVDLLDLFGLSEFRDRKAKGYSKGMRRKLTLAMAMIHEPDILFLDEPTSGLDVQSSILLRQVLLDLNRKGTTIFLTTHDLEEANTLCARIAIIVRGKLAAVDAPERLKQMIQTTRSVEVSLDSMTPAILSDLSGLEGIRSAETQGDKIRLYTPDPSAVTMEVFLYAQKHGRTIVTINTLGPSLEDAFLSIVAREGRP